MHTDDEDLVDVEPVELSSPEPRRRGVHNAVVGAVGLLAVSALAAVFIVGGSGGGTERLPALASAKGGTEGRATAAADVASPQIAPYGGGWLQKKPTVGDGVRAPVTEAPAYKVRVTSATVGALATALGVSGSPRSATGGLLVGTPARLAVHDDGSFEVGDGVVLVPDPNGTSCAQSFAAGPVPCASPGNGGVASVGTASSAGSSGSGGGSTGGAGVSCDADGACSSPGYAPDAPPAVPIPTTTIPGTACAKPAEGSGDVVAAVCVDPVQSPPESTKPAAISRGEAVLAAVGETGTVQAYGAGAAWSVGFEVTGAKDLPGLGATDLSNLAVTSLIVAPDGAVQWGRGQLLVAESVGTYPLMALHKAIDTWWDARQNQPQPAMGKAEPATAVDAPAVAPAIEPALTPTTIAPSTAVPPCCKTAPPTTACPANADCATPTTLPYGPGPGLYGTSGPTGGPPTDLPLRTPGTIEPPTQPVVGAVRMGLEPAGEGSARRLVPVYVLDLGANGLVGIPAVDPAHTAG